VNNCQKNKLYMGAKKIYVYDIEPQDIDFRRKVSLKSLTNFILITAGKNADENGFGIMDLQKEDLTWVLSRLVIQMDRIPHEDDTISIETWIEKIGTAFTTRNFRISDADGIVIGYAATSWAIMDMKTRRSIPLDSIPAMKEFIINESTPIGDPEHLPGVEGEIVNSFTVRYSKIDVNNHANSLYYVQWISDCFSLDFYREHRIRRFDINFLKELTIDDKGKVHREEVALDDFRFEIVTRDKGIACRARLLFEEV
jgi:medium-chain acyl-[acyl-carrier-protein] hydrolase